MHNPKWRNCLVISEYFKPDSWILAVCIFCFILGYNLTKHDCICLLFRFFCLFFKTGTTFSSHIISYLCCSFGQHYMELAKVVYVCKNMYIAIYESSGMSCFSVPIGANFDKKHLLLCRSIFTSLQLTNALFQVATRGNGATTVSATMFFASMVGNLG